MPTWTQIGLILLAGRSRPTMYIWNPYKPGDPYFVRLRPDAAFS